MMKEVIGNNVKAEIRNLFDCFDDSLMYSYFDGIYGKAYCDNTDMPNTAVIESGDFFFVAGKVCCGEEIMKLVGDNRWAVIIPDKSEWVSELDGCGKKLVKVERYRTCPPENDFDVAVLDRKIDLLKKMPQYKLEEIDEYYYNKCLEKDWSKSFVENFKDYDDYMAHGFGFVVTENGEVVSGTSTYSYYNEGVEIEVSTEESHRHQKLATITAAAFLKECVKRKLRPHWDARNTMSLSIAEKAGFVFKEKYLALEFDQSSFEEDEGEI